MTFSPNDITGGIRRETGNTEGTIQLAAEFAIQLQAGDLVAFYGKLGSGKTLFIKAICQSLGVKQEATSPSFTIMNEYETDDGQYIFHFDFYRIEKSTELQQLGLDEFFFGEGICLVEWADRIQTFLPMNRWDVSISFVEGKPDRRLIEIKKR